MLTYNTLKPGSRLFHRAPSPARPQAAAFELPAELRAASPITSDIVVLGLECWEGARPADPTARFREFCIAALCLPARLFLHVPIACIATRSARDARRSFYQLRLPAAAATGILAARRRLHGAHCPVSLDVPRTREEPEIPPAVLAAWRRQRSRDQCRACRQRQSASQPTDSQQRQRQRQRQRQISWPSPLLHS